MIMTPKTTCSTAEITLASTAAPEMRALFNSIANDANRANSKVVHVADQAYVTSFVDLEQAESRPYLVLARGLDVSRGHFRELDWLLWGPLGLVPIGLLAARAGHKHSRKGGA